MTKHLCPICGKYEFEELNSFDICTICGWEDDAVQVDHPDDDTGANEYSFNEYKMKYESGWLPEWLKKASSGVA